jgi:succinylglutamate desuccinylase
VIDFCQGQVQAPLVILLGGMHGNEPSGVEAIEMVFRFIDLENMNGSILGLRGNLKALGYGVRFIHADLNRLWTAENVYEALQDPVDTLSEDEQSLRGLVRVINEAVAEVDPSAIYFLDLHTTSSDGGIFCILTDDLLSISVGQKLGLPCVYDLLKNVKNSGLQYMQGHDWGIPCYALAFEAGHHKDPFSVYRSFASAMRFVDLTAITTQQLVSNPYDHMLDTYGMLPRSTSVKYRYHIEDDRRFMMKPGYKHYSPVRAGDIMARYDGKHVHAEMDGRVLMPLYQKQGSDGFYIVTDLV